MNSNESVLRINTTVTSSPPQCDDWTHAQHVLFQLANVFLAASFVVPGHFKFYWLLLRVAAASACVFMALWGYHIVCQRDVMCWYFASAVVNALYTLYSLYSLYPAQFDSRTESLYLSTLKPIKMARTDFKLLCSSGSIRVVPAGEDVCTEGVTLLGNTVSVLLSGR